jgi:hypothetical protein
MKGNVMSQDYRSLKPIWDSLDDELKECAKEWFMFGKSETRELRLNEVGMSQLLEHLDKHGYEIRKKDDESRLKKAIEIIDDYAYAAGKWIDSDIDYEEFYSWREDLS